MEELERLTYCNNCRCELSNYCDNKMCPYHELQPFYCNFCYEDYKHIEDKHDHRPMYIDRMIELEHDAWRTLLFNC